MNILKLFFLLPSKGDYLSGFVDNEQLKQQAANLWKQLEDWSLWLLLIPIVLSLLVGCYYYYVYNNKPGRHYKMKYWVLFLLISIVASFIATYSCESLLINTNIRDKYVLYLDIAASNILYSLFSYVFLSIAICYLPFKTNAYKFFKL